MKRIIYMLCLLGLTACVPLKPTPIPTPPAVFGSAATAVTIEPDWFVESWRGDQILLKYDSIGEWNIPSTFGRLFEISSHTYTPLELNDSMFFYHAILSINPNQVYYSVNDQVWRYDLQSQQSEYLTKGDEIAEFSNGDFICVSREMTEIWIIDLVSGTEEKILTIPHSIADQRRHVNDIGLSPDEQWLIIEVGNIGSEERDIYLANLNSGDIELILSSDVGLAPQPWSPDGKWIVYIRDFFADPESIFLDQEMIIFNPFSDCIGESLSLPDRFSGGFWSIDGNTILLNMASAERNSLYFLNLEQIFGKPYTGFTCQSSD